MPRQPETPVSPLSPPEPEPSPIIDFRERDADEAAMEAEDRYLNWLEGPQR